MAGERRLNAWPGVAIRQLRGPGGRAINLAEPVVMGVVNATPDSFSDGGLCLAPDHAVESAESMIRQGAYIIDIGGESTRPGAACVDAETQVARVVPVVERLRAVSDVFISIDTSDPEVMRAVAAAGADMINDVRGLRRPGAIEACVETGMAACIGHMQGEPATMQKAPAYPDVVADVRAYLLDRRNTCVRAGMSKTRVALDPGIGFGKSVEHNLDLLRGLQDLVAIGSPLVLGVSRKSMFARLFEDDRPTARLHGSLASAFWGAEHGVAVIRAHDVAETVNMLCLANRLTVNARYG